MPLKGDKNKTETGVWCTEHVYARTTSLTPAYTFRHFFTARGYKYHIRVYKLVSVIEGGKWGKKVEEKRDHVAPPPSLNENKSKVAEVRIAQDFSPMPVQDSL